MHTSVHAYDTVYIPKRKSEDKKKEKVHVVRTFDGAPPMYPSFQDPIEIQNPLPVCLSPLTWVYGVATISRLLKMIGLFCKRAL